jgi:hypothetical protein
MRAVFMNECSTICHAAIAVCDPSISYHASAGGCEDLSIAGAIGLTLVGAMLSRVGAIGIRLSVRSPLVVGANGLSRVGAVVLAHVDTAV